MAGWGAEVLRCLGALVLWCLSAGVVSAQEPPALRAHRVVLEGGVVWSGSYNVGDVTAQLRSNAVGSTPPPFAWFSSSSEVGHAASAAARVGFTLSPRVMVEGGATFGMPHVAVTITGDAEAGQQQLAGEQLKQYLLDGALVWHLPVRLGTRLRAFAVGGAGYLRQLHEERTLVETGQVYYAGVGARYWFRGGSGSGRALGLRGDLRANFRRGGIDFEDTTRLYPTVGVHLFFSL